MPNNKITVVIADDQVILRYGLKAALEREEDMEVVGEAGQGREAVELCRRLKPRVAVMDVGMPGMNGIEATRQITEESPGTKVVALSAHSDRQMVVSMIKAGARAYVLKDSSYPEFFSAIRRAAADQMHFCPEVTELLVSQITDDKPELLEEPPELTRREREILQLISEGHANKEMAHILHIGIKTVESHRKSLTDKLGIKSVAELTKYAIRQGLTTLD